MSSQGETREIRDEADDFPTLSADGLGLGRQSDAYNGGDTMQAECLEHGVWVVRNVLSIEECESICKAASAQMALAHGTLDTRRYRDMKRAGFMCPDASQVLLGRLSKLPLFCDSVTVSAEDTTMHQAPMEGAAGVWTPQALNECWRILQYDSGGHFSPHVDAEYIEGPGCKSPRTFMVYLNDVPADHGGGTCFISASNTAPATELSNGKDIGEDGDAADKASGGTGQVSNGNAADEVIRLTFDEESGKFVMAGNSSVRLKVKPEAGTAIVFNHNMLHMGEELTQGEKWCLRTDMMYTQVEKHGGEELTEADLAAQALLRRAQAVEEDALCSPAGSTARQEQLAQAVMLYARVRSISPAVADAFGL